MGVEPVSSHAVAGGSSQPAGIRSRLTPDLTAIFDAEWEIVLEAAKGTQDLQTIHNLVQKWRHVATAEAKEPGWYFRLQEQAERILAAGSAEAAGITTYDAWAVLEERLRRGADQAT